MSNSSYMNIQFGVLDQVFSDLQASQTSVRTTLDGLVTQVIGPQGTGLSAWDGDAKAAFVNAQTVWTQRCEHMQQVLMAARNHVGNTNELYQSTERGNLQMW